MLFANSPDVAVAEEVEAAEPETARRTHPVETEEDDPAELPFGEPSTVAFATAEEAPALVPAAPDIASRRQVTVTDRISGVPSIAEISK